jgi:hypothetical protein
LSDGTNCSLVSNGINDLTDKNISVTISPNPFTDEISINISDVSNRNFIFNLYDITGKLIINQQFIKSSNNQIKCSKLSNGMYFYTLANNNMLIAKGKIVKQ